MCYHFCPPPQWWCSETWDVLRYVMPFTRHPGLRSEALTLGCPSWGWGYSFSLFTLAALLLCRCWGCCLYLYSFLPWLLFAAVSFSFLVISFSCLFSSVEYGIFIRLQKGVAWFVLLCKQNSITYFTNVFFTSVLFAGWYLSFVVSFFTYG